MLRFLDYAGGRDREDEQTLPGDGAHEIDAADHQKDPGAGVEVAGALIGKPKWVLLGLHGSGCTPQRRAGLGAAAPLPPRKGLPRADFDPRGRGAGRRTRHGERVGRQDGGLAVNDDFCGEKKQLFA